MVLSGAAPPHPPFPPLMTYPPKEGAEPVRDQLAPHPPFPPLMT